MVKLNRTKIHSSKTGSPTLMNYNPENLTKTYDKMIRGDFSVKDIRVYGENLLTRQIYRKNNGKN